MKHYKLNLINNSSILFLRTYFLFLLFLENLNFKDMLVKGFSSIKWILVVFLFVFSSCKDSSTVTLKSLIGEMTARENLSYFPSNQFVHHQFSSYDRASISPEDEGWFANIDRSHFLRVEENNGRREFVMVDAEGPGAIVRWWMTFYRAYDGVIRIYIDNDTEPVIEGTPDDVLIGSMLAEYPFAVSVQAGAPRRQEGWGYDYNLYLPIPFSNHIKITYETDMLELIREVNGIPYYFPDVFYNIGCRIYDKNAKVESFSKEVLEKAKPTIEKASKELLANQVYSSIEENFEKEIIPGDSLVVEFNEYNHALNHIMIEIQANNMNQALRSTVIQASFDGHRTVWIPLGEFFGSGYMTNTHKTWMNQRDENGKMESFYVMPFREKCILTILNYGEETIRINGSVGFADYKWKPNSMYFGASWHEYYQIKTRDEHDSKFDLNFVNIKGKGVYMGDQITLYNNSHLWWGEGDEKIFVDDESFPSIFGTGTEDYYGYSFGRPEVFSHPFIAQPVGSGNTSPGVTVNIRHRSLDGIPFNKAISSNMELWHWDSIHMNYALSSFYYIMLPYETNIKPNIESVQNPVALDKYDLSFD